MTKEGTINEERIRQQIIEAAEQCERLSIPALHRLTTLAEKIQAWPEEVPVCAAIERENTPLLATSPENTTFLIGPEGGFSEEERKALLNNEKIRPVSLGPNILRAETAALYALSHSLPDTPAGR